MKMEYFIVRKRLLKRLPKIKLQLKKKYKIVVWFAEIIVKSIGGKFLVSETVDQHLIVG